MNGWWTSQETRQLSGPRLSVITSTRIRAARLETWPTIWIAFSPKAATSIDFRRNGPRRRSLDAGPEPGIGDPVQAGGRHEQSDEENDRDDDRWHKPPPQLPD